MNFVTDTHALLWWFTDSPKISPQASAIFENCEKGEHDKIIVSTAKYLNLPIVTKDETLQKLPSIKTIW